MSLLTTWPQRGGAACIWVGKDTKVVRLIADLRLSLGCLLLVVVLYVNLLNTHQNIFAQCALWQVRAVQALLPV
jgi:hypothetical protein